MKKYNEKNINALLQLFHIIVPFVWMKPAWTISFYCGWDFNSNETFMSTLVASLILHLGVYKVI